MRRQETPTSLEDEANGVEESPWPSPMPPANPPRAWETPETPGTAPGAPPPGARIYDDDNTSMLPKLHMYAYRGDLNGVLSCITDGHSVHDTVIMRNQAGRLVCGITPLFLAAQKGHYKLVKLLVGNGANPAQPAYIQGSADLCTPLQVARLNLHLRVSYYLKKAVEARKAEDKVLREEEEMQQRPSNNENGAAQADGARGAQHMVMANLGDLSGWDPGAGNQPPLQTGNLIARMLKRNKVDLMTWRPDVERTKDGSEQMVTSANRRVDPNELEGVEVANHTSILNNYLQDADLAQWNPEGEDAYSTRGGAATSVATGRRSLDFDHTGGSNNPSRATSPTPQQRQQHHHAARAQALASSAYVAQHQQQQARGAPASASAAPAAVAQPRGPAPQAFSGAPEQQQGEVQRVNFQQAPAPAPAPALRGRAGPAPSRKPATRWYAHGGSDSEDEEEDLEASASVPAAPPVSLQA